MNWVGMCMLAIIVLALTYACNHNNAGVDLERGLSLPVHPEVSCLQLVIFSYPSYNYPSVHVIVLRMILLYYEYFFSNTWTGRSTINLRSRSRDHGDGGQNAKQMRYLVYHTRGTGIWYGKFDAFFFHPPADG